MQPLPTQDIVLQDFLNGIARVRPRISRLILFGSRARGSHQVDSDYDLLLVVAKKEKDLLDAFYEAVMDVLLTHGRLISLKVYEDREFVRLQELQTPFMKRIAEEGVPLG